MNDSQTRMEYLETQVSVLERLDDVLAIILRSCDPEELKRLLAEELGFNEAQQEAARLIPMSVLADSPLGEMRKELETLKGN